MGKWLAIGGVALIVILAIMWKQVSATAEPARSLASEPPPAPAPMKVAAQVAQPVAPAPQEAAAEESPKVLDPGGDAFTVAFVERVPKVLSKAAAVCYDGKLGTKHRNQKLVLKFKVLVRKGDVTVHDVKVDQSTLGDPALESCFIQKVARGGWRDETLPDYEWDDELVIRPERGLKKYVKENVEYVGPEAPR